MSIQLADGSWGVVDEYGWIDEESPDGSLPDRIYERLRHPLQVVGGRRDREGGERVVEVLGPGPDGSANDNWNEPANAADDGQD
ncbi:hypothetical protein IU418_13425 [Nocardia farcinica]|uniref:hypothetical protein n=1 Tax=Nocardia farcinica TaxID=37329 RepID=UPI001B3C82F7|nr:hypothetical protein [Nocardia farcinica]MBF6538205.1 hypothetical protein [Nocardia farcinica]